MIFCVLQAKLEIDRVESTLSLTLWSFPRKTYSSLPWNVSRFFLTGWFKNYFQQLNLCSCSSLEQGLPRCLSFFVPPLRSTKCKTIIGLKLQNSMYYFFMYRIRKGVPSEARVVARVLPPLLLDFFPAQEIMNKVIGEFLSSQQPHPELMAQVLFKVRTCNVLDVLVQMTSFLVSFCRLVAPCLICEWRD